MIEVALELSQTVHNLKGLDYLSVKVAAEQETLLSQEVVKQAADTLYGVICKEASDRTRGDAPLCDKVVAFLTKSASLLKREDISPEMGIKIAAAVVVDETYQSLLDGTEDKATQQKYAEQQAYGREFFLELVREVI